MRSRNAAITTDTTLMNNLQTIGTLPNTVPSAMPDYNDLAYVYPLLAILAAGMGNTLFVSSQSLVQARKLNLLFKRFCYPFCRW